MTTLTAKEHLIEAFKQSGFNFVERTEKDVTWIFVGDDLADEGKLEGLTPETIPVTHLMDKTRFRLNNFEFDTSDQTGRIMSCG
jgi:hypothetical protein